MKFLSVMLCISYIMQLHSAHLNTPLNGDFNLMFNVNSFCKGAVGVNKNKEFLSFYLIFHWCTVNLCLSQLGSYFLMSSSFIITSFTIPISNNITIYSPITEHGNIQNSFNSSVQPYVLQLQLCVTHFSFAVSDSYRLFRLSFSPPNTMVSFLPWMTLLLRLPCSRFQQLH